MVRCEIVEVNGHRVRSTGPSKMTSNVEEIFGISSDIASVEVIYKDVGGKYVFTKGVSDKEQRAIDALVDLGWDEYDARNTVLET